MKRLFVFLGCVMFLFAGFVPTAGAAFFSGTPSPSLSPVFGTLINFDDMPTYTAVPSNGYVAQGVAAITELGGIPLGYYPGTQSPPNYIGTGSSYGWAGDIQFTFTGLASEVGVGFAGPSTVTYAVYDSSHNLLESNMFSGAANGYYGFQEGTADIKYFEVSSSFFALDDLQFKASAVPLPASLLLFGPGLAGLAAIRRRFKK